MFKLVVLHRVSYDTLGNPSIDGYIQFRVTGRLTSLSRAALKAAAEPQLAGQYSCLMCCPCLPMMAPTDSAGMKRWTVSVSDCCWKDRTSMLSGHRLGCGVGTGRGAFLYS